MNAMEERVGYVRRRIEERAKLAEELRGKAIGASVTDAAKFLRDAEVCEAVAEGMRRTLSILFP